MSSNVYLFEPTNASANANEKPLIQVLREAEEARSRESAKIIARAFRRLTGLFRVKKAAQSETRKNAAVNASDDTRLAA